MYHIDSGHVDPAVQREALDLQPGWFLLIRRFVRRRAYAVKQLGLEENSKCFAGQREFPFRRQQTHPVVCIRS